MLNIYVDGSYRPETREGSYGVIMEHEEFKKNFSGRLGKIKDNNIAEYGAIIQALKEAKRLGFTKKPVKISTDSQVIFRQLLKFIPPPKSTEHSKWYREAANLFKDFSNCMIDFIYSSCNPAHNIAYNALKV